MRFASRILQPGKGVTVIRIEANDLAEARTILDRSGGTILTLKPLHRGLNWSSSKPRFSIPLFTQELIGLLEAGLTLGEGLETLAEKESSPDVRRILDRLLEALRQGKPLSVAVEAQGETFPALYAATLRSAESTGDLVPALTRYLAYHTRIDALRKQVVMASLYPLLLLGVGALVILILVTYVVPRFATVYSEAGRAPPWTTQVLIQFGSALTHHGGIALGALLALAVLIAWGFRLSSVRAMLGRFLWRLPKVGELLRMFQLARFYRSMGMLLSGGIPVVQSLDRVLPLLAAPLQSGAKTAGAGLRRGQPISQAFETGKLTTAVSLRLLRVGEQSGRMSEMMERIALYYDETVARIVERASRLFEPAIMIVIGLVVGGMVVLLYLPIFDLTGAIQ